MTLFSTISGPFGTSRVNLVQSFCCSVSQNGQQLFGVFCTIYKRHTVNTEPAKNLFSLYFSFFFRCWCSCRLLALMSSAAPSNWAAVGGDHFVVVFFPFFFFQSVWWQAVELVLPLNTKKQSERSSPENRQQPWSSWRHFSPTFDSGMLDLMTRRTPTQAVTHSLPLLALQEAAALLPLISKVISDCCCCCCSCCRCSCTTDRMSSHSSGWTLSQYAGC